MISWRVERQIYFSVFIGLFQENTLNTTEENQDSTQTLVCDIPDVRVTN